MKLLSRKRAESYHTGSVPSPNRIARAIVDEAIRQHADAVSLVVSDEHTLWVRYRLNGEWRDVMKIGQEGHTTPCIDRVTGEIRTRPIKAPERYPESIAEDMLTQAGISTLERSLAIGVLPWEDRFGGVNDVDVYVARIPGRAGVRIVCRLVYEPNKADVLSPSEMIGLFDGM